MLKKIKSLFLRQSYLDNWSDYERSLTKHQFTKWDYIILTASNDDQAEAYRNQIEYRLKANLLPKSTHYAVLPDPDGKRVGSGGATLNVLKYISENSQDTQCFKGKRILVIHSGGDSKRVPQYSACGKLFSPVPRELPNGKRSTLFDEFVIGMSGVPSRIQDGMLVLSGDVLLLFNPLQIDFSGNGAAAISIKEDVNTGKNHGVFLSDENGNVGNFLHKQTVEKLTKLGAVNAHGNVDLDTGAVLLSSDIITDLFSLISTNGKNDKSKFDEYVNEVVRLSFYADFLYPLATNSKLEQYYKETPEGDFSDSLKSCRTQLWDILNKYKMKLIALSPAEFIHFGTTVELLNLMTNKISNYTFLDWSRNVNSNVGECIDFGVTNSYIDDMSVVSKNSYIEDSYIINNSSVGENCVISSITLDNVDIPEDTVIHCIKHKNDKFTVRIYGIGDNPKDTLEKNGKILGVTIKEFMDKNDLSVNDLWDNDEHYLWFANLYATCDTIKQSLDFALNVYNMANGCGDSKKFKNTKRTSLYKSFNEANVNEILPWQIKLDDKVSVHKFVQFINDGMSVDKIKDTHKHITDKQVKLLLGIAKHSEFSLKIRIYYYLSKIANSEYTEELETNCFQTIGDTVLLNSIDGLEYNPSYKIKKQQVQVNLPVRVNFGGGWSDTPPYCNENGGTVLNAAIKLKGNLPIEVVVKKLDKKEVVFESADSGAYGVITRAADIQDCNNPFDPFALHKAALLACGIIPTKGDVELDEILDNIGGGIYLSTRVIDIPRGSGLGTSSILAGACVKGLFEFLGVEISSDELYSRALVMEQIMSTGGGWQDQVGGLTNGFKFITTDKGLKQEIKCEQVKISERTLNELEQRFVIIYTGQRRLARNLLREVVGKYIGGRVESIEALSEIQKKAVLMKFELEKGNVDNFAKLMNEHWELSKRLDMGCTNTCIDQIFIVAEDMIDGKMICGAGGGGFLQVVLKKEYTIQDLREKLLTVFQDSGVDVWECDFI